MVGLILAEGKGLGETSPTPSLLGLTDRLVMGLWVGRALAAAAYLGGDSLMPSAVVSPVPTSGAWSCAGRQRCPLAPAMVVALCLGSAGARGKRKGQSTGHIRPPWEVAMEPRVSKLGSLLRVGAGPESTGSTEHLLGPRVRPPPVRPESNGDLSPLCVKAETWLLRRHLVQGTELACKLGMAGTVFTGVAEAPLLETIFPLAC